MNIFEKIFIGLFLGTLGVSSLIGGIVNKNYLGIGFGVFFLLISGITFLAPDTEAEYRRDRLSFKIKEQYDQLYKYIEIYNYVKSNHRFLSASDITKKLDNELKEYQVNRNKMERYRAEWNSEQEEAERNREIESAWRS